MITGQRVVTKTVREVVIKQIFATDRVLNGLGEDGRVYVYAGNEVGWKPLNMEVVESA